ncbi:MAG: hypothetical protein NVS3B8_15390 [Chitinophagaceae bacterium]
MTKITKIFSMVQIFLYFLLSSRTIRAIKFDLQMSFDQVDHFNSFRPAIPPRKFINGETLLYIGRQHRLKIVPATINVIKAYRDQLWIYTSNTSKKALEIQLHQ